VAVRHEAFTYSDPVETATRLVRILREDEGCEAVVALTHMGRAEDARLAAVPGLHLVLGGHDHDYSADREADGVFVVKSGTEFRHLSVIKLKFGVEGPEVSVEKVDITSEIAEAPGWEVDGLGWGAAAWALPGYAWWAIKYHGFKRLAKLRRLL
jgi:5'-nucleotidase